MTTSSDNPLSDKVALVMGASRGIGAEVARTFAAQGALVVAAARDADALARVTRDIEDAGGRAVAVRADVDVEDDVRDAVLRALQVGGRLDVACNNAALAPVPAPLSDIDAASFDAALRTNVSGAFLCLKYQLRAMVRNGGGAIVNVASTAGLEGVANLAGYVASKHALVGLTKVAALDYADHGVRVNAVAPGPILTDRLERAGAAARQAAGAAMPVRRVGTPAEVAHAVAWLCSGEASFVTGATLAIDGGKLAGAPPFHQGKAQR